MTPLQQDNRTTLMPAESDQDHVLLHECSEAVLPTHSWPKVFVVS